MSMIYDNWERLVAATLKREQIWQLCHAHSRETSISSLPSDFSFPSPLPDVPFDSSWYQHNLIPGVEHVTSQVLALAPAPEEIFVNGEPLRRDDLTMLQSSRHPPKKLNPGYYWYDKNTGFWGKKGQKPSQIISPHLNVGGRLDLNASNGNTQVYINGREITKAEQRMLKIAGAKFGRDTYFWMFEDGSYQAEGQNKILGPIWSKAGMKLICSILSLPFPPKTSHTSGEQHGPDQVEQNDVQRLLLIGCTGSGTSTIFNQAKFLYKDVPFSDEEIEDIKMLLQKNTFGYICLLLEGREKFEEENLKELGKDQSSEEFWLAGHSDADDNGKSIYSLVPHLQAFSVWLLKVMAAMAAGDLSTSIFTLLSQKYAPLLKKLLNDPSLQETFKRRSELERLPTFANYFLERATDVFRQDYKPSNMDILYAEGSPSSLSFMDFSFPQSHDEGIDSWGRNYSLPRYQLIRSSCFGFGDDYKSLEMFKDVRIVIICISLNEYDQLVMADNGTSVNKMMASRKFFEIIATHPSFQQMVLLLLLTNYDLFEEEIEQIPLNQCDWFDDFNPVVVTTDDIKFSNLNLGQVAFHYISVKFKRLYTALTGRKLYVAQVSCVDHDTVDAALKYARDIIKWDEETEYLDISSEESIYSDEDS